MVENKEAFFVHLFWRSYFFLPPVEDPGIGIQEVSLEHFHFLLEEDNDYDSFSEKRLLPFSEARQYIFPPLALNYSSIFVGVSQIIKMSYLPSMKLPSVMRVMQKRIEPTSEGVFMDPQKLGTAIDEKVLESILALNISEQVVQKNYNSLLSSITELTLSEDFSVLRKYIVEYTLSVRSNPVDFQEVPEIAFSLFNSQEIQDFRFLFDPFFDLFQGVFFDWDETQSLDDLQTLFMRCWILQVGNRNVEWIPNLLGWWTSYWRKETGKFMSENSYQLSVQDATPVQQEHISFARSKMKFLFARFWIQEFIRITSLPDYLQTLLETRCGPVLLQSGYTGFFDSSSAGISIQDKYFSLSQEANDKCSLDPTKWSSLQSVSQEFFGSVLFPQNSLLYELSTLFWQDPDTVNFEAEIRKTLSAIPSPPVSLYPFLVFFLQIPWDVCSLKGTGKQPISIDWVFSMVPLDLRGSLTQLVSRRQGLRNHHLKTNFQSFLFQLMEKQKTVYMSSFNAQMAEMGNRYTGVYKTPEDPNQIVQELKMKFLDKFSLFSDTESRLFPDLTEWERENVMAPQSLLSLFYS